jgi:hypothetical protein
LEATAAVVSITVRDIEYACDTMAGINAIARKLAFDEHRTEAATICGYGVNTEEDVFDTNAGTLYLRIH